MNEGVYNPTVCVYDDFIYKFGGINRFGFIDRNIERYDSTKDAWINIEYSNINPENEINLLNGSLCCPINDDIIYVFGGYNENGFKTDSAYTY